MILDCLKHDVVAVLAVIVVVLTAIKHKLEALRIVGQFTSVMGLLVSIRTSKIWLTFAATLMMVYRLNGISF